MKAVIFTRVSSVGQEDGVSLDAQEAKLLDYCREKSLDILETFRVVESLTGARNLGPFETRDFSRITMWPRRISK
jgi:hypothetical protein